MIVTMMTTILGIKDIIKSVTDTTEFLELLLLFTYEVFKVTSRYFSIINVEFKDNLSYQSRIKAKTSLYKQDSLSNIHKITQGIMGS